MKKKLFSVVMAIAMLAIMLPTFAFAISNVNAATPTKVLLLTAKKSGSKDVKLTWTKIPEAKYYLISGDSNGKKTPKTKVTIVKDKTNYTVKKIGKKKLSKGKVYTFKVEACTDKNGKKKVKNVKTNVVAFIAGEKGSGSIKKNANATKITITPEKTTLLSTVDKDISLKAKATYPKGKKVLASKYGSAISYFSDNSAVTVSSKGKMTAQEVGEANIYAVTLCGKSMTVHVVVNPAEFSIIYKDNNNAAFSGQQAGAPEKHAYGKETTLLEPTRRGYNFDGWYLNEDCVNDSKVTALGAKDFTTDITLYAKWTPCQYRIIYRDCGDNKLTGTNPTGVPQTHTFGMVTKLQNPTKLGYDFDGWYTTEACSSGTKVTELTATGYAPTGDGENITLYAKWNAKQYDINYYDEKALTFSGSHPSGAPTKYISDKTTTLMNPTKVGYEFNGWYKNLNCSDVSKVTTLEASAYSDNINLYAKWTPCQYKITYRDCGDSKLSGTNPTGAPETHTYGTITKLQNPTKVGFKFDGWYTTEECNDDTKVLELAAKEYTQDISLYAKWVPSTYTITYRDNGDAGFTGTNQKEAPANHTYGTTTLLLNPTRTGYQFDGWYTTPNCKDGTKVSFLEETKYTSDITLFAKWIEKDGIHYKIEYKDQNGESFTGSMRNAPDEHVSGTTTILKEPTRRGYGFAGWYTSKDCEGEAITKLGANDFDGDIVLYALWNRMIELPGQVYNLSEEVMKSYDFYESNTLKVCPLDETDVKDIFENAKYYALTSGKNAPEIGGISCVIDSSNAGMKWSNDTTEIKTVWSDKKDGLKNTWYAENMISEKTGTIWEYLDNKKTEKNDKNLYIGSDEEMKVVSRFVEGRFWTSSDVGGQAYVVEDGKVELVNKNDTTPKVMLLAHVGGHEFDSPAFGKKITLLDGNEYTVMGGSESQRMIFLGETRYTWKYCDTKAGVGKGINGLTVNVPAGNATNPKNYLSTTMKETYEKIPPIVKNEFVVPEKGFNWYNLSLLNGGSADGLKKFSFENNEFVVRDTRQWVDAACKGIKPLSLYELWLSLSSSNGGEKFNLKESDFKDILGTDYPNFGWADTRSYYDSSSKKFVDSESMPYYLWEGSYDVNAMEYDYVMICYLDLTKTPFICVK